MTQIDADFFLKERIMKKSLFFGILVIIIVFISGCYGGKNSPFYDSEWIMNNIDGEGSAYYHHLILTPDHKVMLRASYFDSTNIMVWNGTYKINSKKIIFNFTDCVRYEEGRIVGNYSDKRLIKYYSGEFLYSLAETGTEEIIYNLQLTRPKNQIYGEAIDIFGNHLAVFSKVNKKENQENQE